MGAPPRVRRTSQAAARPRTADQALAGKPIDTPTSTPYPYGCSIKYGP